jgi:hypothetical protein
MNQAISDKHIMQQQVPRTMGTQVSPPECPKCVVYLGDKAVKKGPCVINPPALDAYKKTLESEGWGAQFLN